MDLTDKIKSIPLRDVISAAGIKISSKGFACCPFHDDRDPSFHVKNNRFKCFGCGASGDAVDFIQKLHGLSFKEALRYLGIESGPITANLRREIRERERKRKIEDERRQRRRDLLYTLSVRIRKIRKVISNIKTAGQMEA